MEHGKDKRDAARPGISRRTALKGLGAAALTGGYVLSANSDAVPRTADTENDGDGDTTPLPEKNVTPEKPAPFDFSWMTLEHAEDILGMMYHGHNAGALVAHAADGWTYDQYGSASREHMPWGGKCTVVYNIHTQEQKVLNLSLDLLTIEGQLQNDGETDGEWRHKVPEAEGEIIRENRSIPTYLVDIATDAEAEADTLKKAVAAEFAMIVSGLVLALLKSPTPRHTALETYLMSGLGVMEARELSHKEGGSLTRVTGLLNRVQEDLPTMYTFLIHKLRNVIAAEKNAYLANIMDSKSMATVWGVGHAGIETEMMRTSHERMAFIWRWKPLIERIYVHSSAGRPTLWTCRHCEHFQETDGSFAFIFKPPHIEVPTLKSLFSEQKS